MLKKQHLTPHDRLSRAKERLGKSKGSVLFFVLAIMSVMIVMASAVYYAVASARQEVEAKYSSEHAYQSAISINDMVSDYIAADPNNKFISAAIGLAEGESIKTNITDLPAGTGNVSVTITKISGGADSAILSITTESVVNGETQVVTSVGELKEGEAQGEAASLSRFFTSTGYVPNDTLFQSKDIVSELFFDCEYTEVGGEGDNVFLKADIITSGSMKFHKNVKLDSPPKPINLTVGNDLYLTEQSAEILDFNGGTVRVGGSVIQTPGAHTFSNANLYIQGDYYSGAQDNKNNKVYVNGNLVLFGNTTVSGDVYVNGDVFIDRSFNKNSIGEIANSLTVGGNFYYDGNKANVANDPKADVKGKKIQADINFNITNENGTMIYKVEEAIEKIIADTAAESGGVHGYSDIWPCKAGDTNPCESMATVTQNITETLGNNKYIDWQLDKLFHVGENESNPYIPVTPIEFGQNDKTYTLSAKDNDKFIIQDIDVKQGNGSALIIDTADGAGGFKDVYIMLKPNGIYDEEKGSFTPAQAGKAIQVTTYQYSCPLCHVTFERSDMSWYQNCPSCGLGMTPTLLGTKTEEKTYQESDLNAFMFCDTVADDYGNRNTNFFHVMVKGKGSVVFFIPNGETFVGNGGSFIGHYALYKELRNGSEDLDIAQNATSNLNDFINNSNKFDKEKGLFNKDLIKTYSDEGLYLHNNIFLASSDKNISINFPTSDTLFAGLIYAPYMQFNESGGTGASNKAYLGGLVVSNFNLESSQPMTFYCAVYDYYDRFVKDTKDDGSPLTDEEKEEERGKYLANLMGQTGSNQIIGGAGGGQLGRAWKKFGYN